MDEEAPAPDPETIRTLFVEMAELLEAIVIALQTDRSQEDNEFVVREAVRRIVRLREHLSDSGID